MLEKIYHLMSGYVEFQVNGDGARLFTLASKRGIGLWGFSRSEGQAVARIKPRSYRQLRPIARRCQATTRITRKRGLPFQWQRLRARKGLLIGAVAGSLLFWFLSGFMWGVDISGLEQLPPGLVSQAAEECGVFPGARKSDLNPKTARMALLNRLPALSWATVNTNGCYVEVVVREGAAKPEYVERVGLSNIVAAREGMVVKMEAQEGRPEVVPGQVVTEGQLLIAGLYQEVPDPYGPQPERLFQQAGAARGSVTAETYRTFTVQVSSGRNEPVETGKSIRTWIEIFGVKLPLGLWHAPREDNRVYRERQQLTVLGTKLPLTVEWETVADIEQERRELTEDQQRTAALLKLRETQKAVLPPGSSVREEELEFSFAEGVCVLSAKCRCWEEIGVVQEISVK